MLKSKKLKKVESHRLFTLRKFPTNLLFGFRRQELILIGSCHFFTMKNLQLIILFLLPLAIFAQTPTPTATPADDDVISVESRLITVPVSVLNANGQPLLGLKLEDFSLNEEGKLQQIEQVSDAEKVPLEIALLLDVSGSTDSMFPLEQQTAASFLRSVMKPEDRATIYAIGETPVLVQPRDTAEKSASNITKVMPTKGFTAFYDTVSAAAKYLNKNSQPKSRKVIITISDGEDTNSDGIRKAFAELYRSLGNKMNTLTSKELRDLIYVKRNEVRGKEQAKVMQNLQNADTVFYSLNPAGSSFQLNKMSVFGQQTMQAFADQTGGTAFLPKFLPTNLKEPSQNRFNAQYNEETLRNIFNQLTNELRSQYLLQYYSDGGFTDGKYVKLTVGLKKGQGLRLRARQGYFVEKK
jgi:VWFA-related protein